MREAHGRSQLDRDLTMSPTNTDLGQAIRRLRRAHHLTIEDLAFDARMHPTYLSGIERGIRNPTWGKLSNLADALGVPVSAVAHDAEKEAEIARIEQDARARIEAEPANRRAAP
jgi:transcriptional regulator with XRE-family HTH domain